MQARHSLISSQRHSKATLTFKVKSFSRRGVSYTLQYSDKKWSCSCPDAQHRNGVCKHAAIAILIGAKRIARLVRGGRG